MILHQSSILEYSFPMLPCVNWSLQTFLLSLVSKPFLFILLKKNRKVFDENDIQYFFDKPNIIYGANDDNKQKKLSTLVLEL